MIPFNPLALQWPDVQEQARRVFEALGQESHWILGPRVQAFESALAARWDRSFAVGTGCGLDAIEIGLRSLGLLPGDKVMTTPLSAFATTLAILHVGAVPVFVDVDDRGLLDLSQCEKALHEIDGIRAIVPVHLYGQAMNLTRLECLRDQFHLIMVEDCAQSIGAKFQERHVGSVGQAAAVSFYPTKNLGAFGDAGALLTSDPQIAEQAREMRDYGQKEKYLHVRYGLNSRLDELQAAMLHEVLLPHLSEWTRLRRDIARRYLSGLRKSSVRPLGTGPLEESVWHLFPVVIEGDRERFRRHLTAEGVETAVHYPCVIPDQPLMKSTPSMIHGDIGRARWIAAREVSLPIHPWMKPADVDRVLEACLAWKP